MTDNITQEDKERITQEIDSHGFANWVMRGYAERTLSDYPNLVAYVQEIKRTLKKLETSLKDEDVQIRNI